MAAPARFDLDAPVLDHRPVAPGIHELTVEAPGVAAAARPGQFCMLAPAAADARDPLLRRPLSIHRVADGGRVVFLYRVVGRGTALLAARRPGDLVRVLGPLGRGFTPGAGPAVLVGGGMGIAPLLFLAERLPAGHGHAVVLGARTAAELPGLDRFEAAGHRLLVATEDGSLGEKGLVTGILEGLLEEAAGGDGPALFACGPWPMLRAVREAAAAKRLPLQVSLETRMACGVGLCLGCAVPRPSGEGYHHVCREGPVFDAEAVSWEAPPP
ncbi:dihydroorotate dehydrogenase electron transfer subunit [Dissulfurirhabdus thermomarina]|uniref:dihydroorotate dehydrogenase electron transfer subunit n=1 Tax=Dissulfurirhabdus thermomarina TaxID=1765737 RepID=UPI002852EB81|nr:dihydroorotate dehydrogenase electron transfer subunit [Dissulfurirhabdus thermomarina]